MRGAILLCFVGRYIVTWHICMLLCTESDRVVEILEILDKSINLPNNQTRGHLVMFFKNLGFFKALCKFKKNLPIMVYTERYLL